MFRMPRRFCIPNAKFNFCNSRLSEAGRRSDVKSLVNCIKELISLFRICGLVSNFSKTVLNSNRRFVRSVVRELLSLGVYCIRDKGWYQTDPICALYLECVIDHELS